MGKRRRRKMRKMDRLNLEVTGPTIYKAPDTLRQLCCVLTYYTLTIDPTYFKILREYLVSILHSIQSVAMHTLVQS